MSSNNLSNMALPTSSGRRVFSFGPRTRVLGTPRVPFVHKPHFPQLSGRAPVFSFKKKYGIVPYTMNQLCGYCNHL